MKLVQKIQPHLWFDSQAEEAARHYTGIFPDSAITAVSHYGEAGREVHGRAPGSVMTVAFTLAGQAFTALNGGPAFQFSPAISLMVQCADQPEIDHYWHHLGAGGDPAAQQCGWLKDRYGLSWQIVPARLAEIMGGADPAAAQRTMAAVMKMKKLDLAALERAHRG